MNIFKSSVHASLFAAILVTSTFAFAQDAINRQDIIKNQDEGNGTLTFIYDLGEGECTIPVRDKYQLAIRHADKPPTNGAICKGHSIRAIQFNNVRSAVSVWLASEFDPYNHAIGCDYLDEQTPNNFLFELRTLKTVTNSTPIKLDELTPQHVAHPVIPGVLLKSRWVNNTHSVNRHLSCVRINFD